MRKIKAVGYRRVSTSQQRLGGYSLPQQKLEIEAYAATHAMQLVADYSDDQTGTNTNRPGLEQALDDLRSGKAEALIICENDRLTRSAPDYMWLRETLREMGMELHNARRGQIDLNDFGSQIVEDVYGRVAEMERQRIVERMRGGKMQKARQGRVVNPNILPYGYSAVDGAVVVVDEEAAIVQEIFNLYAAGEAMGAIASQLTKRRVPTYMDSRPLPWTNRKKAGIGEWSRSTIYRMLKNETYLGRWHYNKTDGDGLPNDRDQWVEVSVPAIVDEKTFNQANNRLRENKRLSKRNTKRNYLAQGRIICACGQSMRSRTFKYNGKFYSYYVCKTCQNLRSHDVDHVLWEWIKRMLNEPDYLTGLVEDYLKNEETTQDGLTGQLAELRSRIDNNVAKQRRFAKMFIAGDIDDEALAEIGASLRGEKEGLLAEERRLINSLNDLSQARDHASDLLQVMSTFSHGLRFFGNEPFHIRRGWVEALNASVHVQPGSENAMFKCFFGGKILSIVDKEFQCLQHNWQIELVAILPIREEANCGSCV